jgi:hypothetical protein
VIRLKFCTIEVRDGAVWTVFPDGAVSANYPPSDDGQFYAIALMCGFTDPMRYCLAHEVTHALVPEVMFDRESYVVGMAARGRKCSIAAAKAEERLCWYVQRAACGAIATVDPDWVLIADRLRQLGLAGDPATAGHETDWQASHRN